MTNRSATKQASKVLFVGPNKPVKSYSSLEPLVVPEHSLVLEKIKVPQYCGTFELEPVVVPTARLPSSLANVKVPQRCGTFELEPLIVPEHSFVFTPLFAGCFSDVIRSSWFFKACETS